MKKLLFIITIFMASYGLWAQAIVQKATQQAKSSIGQAESSRKSAAKAKTAAGEFVGIGTATPAYPLHLNTTGGDGFVHSNGSVILATYNDGGSGWFGTNTNHDLHFYTNYSNPQLTLKSGGILGVNTSTPANFVKFQVNGGAIFSEKEDETEQILIGTTEANNEAKVLIRNTGYPNALKIDGLGSTSGNALHVEGGTLIKGELKVTGKISKGAGTFQIDHPQDPLNKYLYHSFVESPDMMNVYNGNITTDAEGNATVQLPGYFESLNVDYRYQLTPIGAFAQAIIFEKVKNNAFKIKTDKPNIEVSWQVTGVRNDPYARQNRVKTEVTKPESEKGTYLHPEAYGLGNN